MGRVGQSNYRDTEINMRGMRTTGKAPGKWYRSKKERQMKSSSEQSKDCGNIVLGLDGERWLQQWSRKQTVQGKKQSRAMDTGENWTY